MKFTNKKGLNEMLVKAITADTYGGSGEKRDYSVTQLLNPPKVVLLSQRHHDEISEDVSEHIFRLLGSAIHSIIEYALGDNPDDKHMNEKRFAFTTQSGKLITGGIDYFNKETGILEDYKITSVWTWIYRNREDSRITDWTRQLNIYRLMLERAGYEVNGIKVNMIFRDFSKSKARHENNYPDPVETIDIPLLGLDIVEQMLEESVANVEKYKASPDNAIPPCTASERWQQKDTWAVRKLANKTASKVEFSYAGAKAWLDNEVARLAARDIEKGMNADIAREKAYKLFAIEKREGVPTRCIDYCTVNKFCHFWQQLPASIKDGR